LNKLVVRSLVLARIVWTIVPLMRSSNVQQ